MDADFVLVIRALFVTMASTIVIAYTLPGLQDRFITYGARASADRRAEKQFEQPAGEEKSIAAKILDWTSSLRVPHRWFLHFYLVSVSLSLFWAVQFAFKGSAYTAVAELQLSSRISRPSMTAQQVLLAWLMMLLQGIRRLYESYVFAKPSSSQMWIAHWAVGIVFYTCMSIAVWIEGIDALSTSHISWQGLLRLQPTVRSFIAIPLFLVASGIQYDCHTYLASLKKYSLPTHPIFTLLICPHYTAECLIYLSLAIAAAPAGHGINGTLACALVFVAANLGITARSTRRWYAAKFGDKQIKNRWTMIPLVW